MDEAHLPFFDLFLKLQASGMKLSLEQYDLLRQALQQGHGVGGWQDLRRVCRILWVKPSVHYASDAFDHIFEQYQQDHEQYLHRIPQPTQPPQQSVTQPPQQSVTQPPQQSVTQPPQQSVTQPPQQSVTQPPQTNQIPLSRLPQIPFRNHPSSQAQGETQISTAVKAEALSSNLVEPNKYTLFPTKFPLSRQTIQDVWQYLRHLPQASTEYELDLAATISQINRTGFFSDVMLRPMLTRRIELLLLVDTSNAMLPYRPVLQPLIDVITEHRVTPAQIYGFTVYPDEYLYDWQRPYQAIALSTVLSQLHQRRTLVVIWSDAGAAVGTNSPEQTSGIYIFLSKLAPCIRDCIWFNPLPSHRWWKSLTTRSIAQILDGRMLYVGNPDLLNEIKQRSVERFYPRPIATGLAP